MTTTWTHWGEIVFEGMFSLFLVDMKIEFWRNVLLNWQNQQDHYPNDPPDMISLKCVKDFYYYMSRIYSTSWFSLDYYNFRKVSSNFFWCTYSCGQHQTHLRKVYTKFWPSLHKLQSFQKVLKSFLNSVNSEATVKKIFLDIQEKAILLSMFEICRNFSWKCKCIKMKTYFKNEITNCAASQLCT